MIEFLYQLNKELKKESNMHISYRKKRDSIKIRVFDFKKRGIRGVKVYLNKKFLGLTNPKGIVEANEKITKKSIIRAELGIYYAKKELIP